MNEGKSRPSENKKKILVGMSGGMNSAVTAALLKSQGYQVQGVYLQLADPKASDALRFRARCCMTKNAAQAKEVCRKLDIPLQIAHVENRFESEVIDGFVHDLLQSRTPNPCIPCNLEIRIDTLLKKADELGCEQVATGHHAQILHDASGTGEMASRARLSRAADASKDQSYYLFGVEQKQLARLMFPLGGFQYAMISRLAQEFELPTVAGGDPNEICLSQGDARVAFFESRVAPSLRPPGIIRLSNGTVMGDHRGLHAFRVGQQKIKLAPHIKDSDKYIVTQFDGPSHALVIGDAKDLFQAELRASRATWVRPLDGLHGLKTTARVSPAQRDALPCSVTLFENRLLRVEFEQPCQGLLVGSAIVFYDGEEVLGGAFIDTVGSLPLEN